MVTLATDANVAGFLGQVAALITATSVILGAVAWLVWPRFKGFLQRELIGPVHEAREAAQDARTQVQDNGHKHDQPTLKDELRDLKDISTRNRRTLLAVQAHVQEIEHRLTTVEDRQERVEGRELQDRSDRAEEEGRA